MSEIFGTDCVVYYGNAQAASGSLVELQGIRNVSLNQTGSEADLTVRGSRWKRTAITMNDISVDIELLYEKENVGLAKLRDAYLAGSGVELAILTGDIATSGTEGPKGEFRVASFNRGEGTENPVTVSVGCRLYDFDTYLEIGG